MGLFKKKNDIVDLTHLRQRGILDKRVQMKSDESRQSNSSHTGSSDNENLIGFSGTFEDSVPDNSSGGSSYVNRLREQRKTAGESSMLKVKLEDLEYKLDRYLERLEAVENKLDEISA